jgi:hypothetical protein
MQQGDVERNEFIKKCEEMIQQFEQQMHQAVMREDGNTLSSLTEGWRLAQESWLVVAQWMSPEKARAVMVGFAMNELINWMNERRPSLPPSVLTLYSEGPIGKKREG